MEQTLGSYTDLQFHRIDRSGLALVLPPTAPPLFYSPAGATGAILQPRFSSPQRRRILPGRADIAPDGARSTYGDVVSSGYYCSYKMRHSFSHRPYVHCQATDRRLRLALLLDGLKHVPAYYPLFHIVTLLLTAYPARECIN
jgi:hypothetical protein